MPLNFGLFCKKCGSYDIRIRADQTLIGEETIEQVTFLCKNCDIIEQIQEE
jgi:hypothetical protein